MSRFTYEDIAELVLTPKVEKHGNHDQSSHGNWAEGSQNSVSELSDDEIRDVIYNSKTVDEMFHKVAKRLGKSMKPSVANLSEDEITHYRGVPDVSRDAQRLLDGKIKFTEFQTWGQGIYLAEEKSVASNYGTLMGLKLDSSAKMVRGETAWDSAFEVSYDNPSARTRNTTTSDFIDLSRIETQIRAGKMDNLSISDMRNVYWAAKGYDGFTTYGETVLFNGSKLTVNKADIGTAVQKHGNHDQKTHGSWATGSVPTSITTTTDAIGQEKQTITYGDIVIERDKPGEVRDSDDSTRVEWTFREGASAMRFVSSRIMGIDVTNTPHGVMPGDQKSLIEGTIPESQDPSAKPGLMDSKVPAWISGAYTLMEDVRTSTPYPDALHRGIRVDTNSSILNIKEGQVLELPISAASTQRKTADMYGGMAGPFEMPVFFTIAKGAKATPIRFSQMTDGSPVAEYVTQGKFKVVSVNKSSVVMEEQWSDGKQSRRSGSVEVVLEQTDVFSIDKGGYESVKP